MSCTGLVHDTPMLSKSPAGLTAEFRNAATRLRACGSKGSRRSSGLGNVVSTASRRSWVPRKVSSQRKQQRKRLDFHMS